MPDVTLPAHIWAALFTATFVVGGVIAIAIPFRHQPPNPPTENTPDPHHHHAADVHERGWDWDADTLPTLRAAAARRNRHAPRTPEGELTGTSSVWAPPRSSSGRSTRG